MTTYSPQQKEFLAWVKDGSGSCVLEAVAGAGKTTALLGAVDLLPGGTAIVAFNKKIAEEIKNKLQKKGVDWKKAQAGTCHSFGFAAYRKAFPNVKVDSNKIQDIATGLYSDKPFSPFLGGLAQLVSLAKQKALGVIGLVS